MVLLVKLKKNQHKTCYTCCSWRFINITMHIVQREHFSWFSRNTEAFFYPFLFCRNWLSNWSIWKYNTANDKHILSWMWPRLVLPYGRFDWTVCRMYSWPLLFAWIFVAYTRRRDVGVLVPHWTLLSYRSSYSCPLSCWNL